MRASKYSLRLSLGLLCRRARIVRWPLSLGPSFAFRTTELRISQPNTVQRRLPELADVSEGMLRCRRLCCLVVLSSQVSKPEGDTKHLFEATSTLHLNVAPNAVHLHTFRS